MSLFPSVGNPRYPLPHDLPFKLSDYLELFDWFIRVGVLLNFVD
ncbi:hypothetical protein QWZ13_03060 [Reinekea marina]|nr:hypothetical protein [Reinekea marina]MDN3647890.1 hypothetical protein [Reinekea marina]